ncbi:drug/metabolite transporter (DMT)-like permease [Salirhabdus euzebyi]|uniref:Drug/metabolite transporter (DMT)-like permease n=1 Tax=Salirhabdus euzebyi TaxID=394506 RepID=A0A841Q987_9BACI|nr:EamA family transporter [Salirhabdus euzebyi]MBB6454956.1 drug/metabolite transporter (DMT)-like permease [Salirhabdus euzebyi]
MFKSYVLLLITVIIFAGNLLVGRAINDLPAFTITFFRCFIALLIILPFGIKQLKAKRELFKKEWKPLIGMGFTGIILFNLLVYSSLVYTTSTNAAIVETTAPIFTIIIGALFLKERLNKLQYFGMVLSLTGAIWVITKGSWQVITGLQFNIGDIIMLVAMLMWSIYSILVKEHNSKYPAYGGLTIMLSLAVVVLFPFALVEWLRGIESLFTLEKILGLLYLGIFPSIIALMFWNKGVQDIGPSRASIFLNLLPVFTIIGAVLFLGEKVIWAQLFGGFLVITGVILSTRGKGKRKDVMQEEKLTDKSIKV